IGHTVKLEWITEAELNNDSFAVEKEVFGGGALSSFTEIGKVKGAGTSTTTHHYELIDDSPVESNQMWNYYRLKQVDNDGKFTYCMTSYLFFFFFYLSS